MKYRIFFILFLVFLFSICVKNVSASELCSPNGYTLLTLNGIFTDLDGAINNKDALDFKFHGTYNNQPLKVDYLYNPTHGKVVDALDATAQKYFEQNMLDIRDSDFAQMLSDASAKVATQKLLLVGHSQGNFYANTFYDAVADEQGGVPSQSIGVYGVATPSNHVAGGGMYITSDTDKVIAGFVSSAPLANTLKPNAHIDFKPSDGDSLGHSFSDIYLPYEGPRIISEIKSSLDKLKDNNVQDENLPCINPPKLTLTQKIQSTTLAFVDGSVNSFNKATNFVGTTYLALINGTGGILADAGLAIGNIFSSLPASVVQSLPNSKSLTTGPLAALDDANDNSSASPSQTSNVENKVTDSVQPTDNNSSVEEAGPSPTVSVSDKNTINTNTLDNSKNSLNTDTSKNPYPNLLPGGGGVAASSSSVTQSDDTSDDNSSGDDTHDDTPVDDTQNPDTTPPAITILGNNPATVTVNTTYTDAGATATDDVDGDLTSSIIKGGTFIDTNTLGTYTITYTATDSSNNISTVTRTINVVAVADDTHNTQPTVDTIPPVITILGNNPEVVVVGSVYTDAGATALDNVDGDLTSSIVKSGTFTNTNTVGNYTIIYTIVDSSNNSSTATRAVNVVAPTLPPENSGVDFVIDKNTTLSSGEYNYDNLIITNNAVLTLEGDPASLDSFKGVKITAKNITIEPGSTISADAKGYGQGQGPGNSSDYTVGASYGGLSYNGATHSTIYGSAIKPVDLGSGGGISSYGGGAVRIIVSNTFTDNGVVSSNGGTTSSGGSIYVTAKNMAGNGVFRANGGGLYAGNYFVSPGGGGRVAVYYQTSSFNGTAEAKGGCGYYGYPNISCGQDGTVGFFDTINNDFYVNNSWQFLQSDAPFSFNNIYTTNGSKVISEDNVNITANNFTLDKNSSFNLSNNQILNIGSINIDGSSVLTLSGTETITANSLTVNGNSMVTIIPGKILSLTIPNINVASGSYISADAKGYGQGQGPGNSPTVSVGASYGGVGYQNIPESIYGSETQPVDFGSGGSGNFSMGGGAIRLISTNILVNNGIISASGNNTSSGGSIYVTANTISGAGTFQANGGGLFCPYTCYGPGGGGRIALYYKNSSFSGITEAKGGSGYISYPYLTSAQDGTVHIVDESVASSLSSAKQITSFNFAGLTPNVTGVIDETNHTISLTVPFDTDVTALVPAIAISSNASIVPNNNVAQDFTNPVTYTVTAQDNSTQNYIVTVTIAPDPNPIPSTTTLSITGYTFNGIAADATVNPTTANPLSIVINASENVNWTSIKIEKQDNASLYRMFKADSSGCRNDTNTCTKSWDGLLTRGGLLQNGTYRIKLHVKDAANNEFYDYLTPYIINVNIP